VSCSWVLLPIFNDGAESGYIKPWSLLPEMVSVFVPEFHTHGASVEMPSEKLVMSCALLIEIEASVAKVRINVVFFMVCLFCLFCCSYYVNID